MRIYLNLAKSWAMLMFAITIASYSSNVLVLFTLLTLGFPKYSPARVESQHFVALSAVIHQSHLI